MRTISQENLNSMMLWTKLVSYQTALTEACTVYNADEILLVLSAEQLRLQPRTYSIFVFKKYKCSSQIAQVGAPETCDYVA